MGGFEDIEEALFDLLVEFEDIEIAVEHPDGRGYGYAKAGPYDGSDRDLRFQVNELVQRFTEWCDIVYERIDRDDPRAARWVSLHLPNGEEADVIDHYELPQKLEFAVLGIDSKELTSIRKMIAGRHSPIKSKQGPRAILDDINYRISRGGSWLAGLSARLERATDSRIQGFGEVCAETQDNLDAVFNRHYRGKMKLRDAFAGEATW